MNLTEPECKEAPKYISNWGKFAGQWPKLRWFALFVLLLSITASVMEYRAFDKMNELNTHNSLMGEGTVAPA